jgi:hypothetical protein
VLTHTIEVATNEDEPGKLPFRCQFDDYSRILFVFTYAGSILAYPIPEVPIDLDEISRNQNIPLEEEEIKKKLRYPLTYSHIESQVTAISQPVLTLPFEGKKVVLNR